LVELLGALALLIGPAPLTGATIATGDVHHAWAGGRGGIVATADGGATWNVQSRRSTHEIVAADASHAWALTGDETLRTTDGVHWRSLGDQGLLRMSFVDRSNGFAIERLYYLLRTRDGGATWTPTGGPKQLQSLCFSDAQTGWVARGGTVWTTHDAGADWTKRTLMRERQGFPNPELYCHGDNVWAVFHGGAAAGTEGYTIFRSLDGGKKWRALFASFSTKLQMVSNYSGPIAALGGGVAVLEGSCSPCGAGSVTFVRMPTRSRKTLQDVLPGPVAFATRALGLAVLTPSPRGLPTIYRTTDGGRMWRRAYASALLRP
jgi:photosystem II stability/assembly factor-like uncharacterized protein